jgi:hypothetical protein
MSNRRDDDAPLTGGRAPSSTQAPGSGSEPEAGSGSEPGGPVLSTGSEPPSTAGPGSGSRARPPAPEPTGPALRVVLVSRDNMLAGALRSLIEAPGGVRMLDWHSDELDSAIRYADVVVVDMPPSLHQRTFAVIAGRFLGRTVVLLQEGERPEALPPGPPRAILYRPLQIGELWGAVTGALPAIPATPRVADAVVAPDAEEPEAEVPVAGEATPPAGPGDPGTQAPVAEGQGLPLAESGRLIGLSGQELDPVIGPGQVAPGMDEATLERLRRWGTRGRQPTTGRSGAAAGKRRDPAGSTEAARADRPTVGRAKAAEARREQSRQAKTEARQAARADAARVRAARAEARTAAREQSRQAKEAQARERQVARERARQARQAEQAAAAEAAREADKVREAEQAAAREAAQQAKAARQAEQAAAREAAGQAKAAQAAEKAAAREAARQAKAAEAAVKAAAAEAAREAKKAREAELAAAKEAERQAKAAREAELAAAREAERTAKAAREAELAAAREAERTAAREAARQAKAARAAESAAAREAARKARAEDAAARRVARAARAEQRRVARDEARQQRQASAAARRAERAEARQARAVRAAVRRAVRAEAAQARATRREESKRVRAARAEERRAARAQARQERAARTEARRERSRQERATRAEERRTARAAAAQAKAAAAEARREETQRARAAQAEARKEAREESARQRAARTEARTAARDEARQAGAARAKAQQAARAEAAQARGAQAEERRVARAAEAQARAAQAEQRRAARAEAGRERAAQARARRDQARRVRAARAEARKEAHDEAARQRAAHAAARKRGREEARAARAEAARAQARQEDRPGTRQRTWPGARQVPRQGARAGATHRQGSLGATQGADRPGVFQGRSRIRATQAPAGLGTTPNAARLLEAAGPILVVLALAAVGLAAAGWRGGGGPDTVAGEVAVVRAAGGSQGGLVAQDPRVGPIAPLHALVTGAWLRVTEAGGSLEGVIREARGPSRVALAGVVGLTVLLFLLLMRVGPGSGAAAGPGPAPPQGRRRWWRLSGAALAGALVALDPLLVRNGRAATGTVLAVALALAALALAWGLPARPALRWAPLVGAVGGLALLVSPLALPVLAVPVVAELLEGRHREAWRGMAALGLAVGLWLLLPVWVAGRGLDPGQVGWLLGRPPGRGPLTASLAGESLSWLLIAAGLAAALLAWRLRSGARPGAGPGAARLTAWAATTAAGALVAIALGYPASQALALAIPAAAVSLSLALLAATTAPRAPRWAAAATGVALAGLLVAQGLSWGSRYGQPADDGLGRLVATVAAQLPACSAVNAAGPDDRARLLAAGVTVTEFSSGPAAHAAGVRYFTLTGATAQGGPQTRSLAAWVRQHGSRLADLPSPSLSGIELWRVDAPPLDPVADVVPIPGGIFSNVSGSACGGYRVVDSQLGAFHTGYRAAGGKAVLGRPLGTVWTSDGPALQAFDTMVLGGTPSAGGPPDVKPIELPPLLAKLDVEAVADADIPLPSARPPVTDRQAQALLDDRLIARAYLGTSPGSASAEDWRRARERFGRPLGRAQTMPDGAVRQPFERAVLELPAGGGPVRPAALGRLAVRLGLVPGQAMRLEPVPGLPARPAEVRLDPSPLLRPLGVALALLAVAAATGAVAARRSRSDRAETARSGH